MSALLSAFSINRAIELISYLNTIDRKVLDVVFNKNDFLTLGFGECKHITTLKGNPPIFATQPSHSADLRIRPFSRNL